MLDPYQLLPVIVQIQDRLEQPDGSSGILERFMGGVKAQMEDIAQATEGIRDLYNADLIPLEFLTYLAMHLGTYIGDGPEGFRRWFVKNLVAFYKIKATHESFRFIWSHYAPGATYTAHELWKSVYAERGDYAASQDGGHTIKAARVDIYENGAPLSYTDALAVWQFIASWRPIHVLLRTNVEADAVGDDVGDIGEEFLQTIRSGPEDEIDLPDDSNLTVTQTCVVRCQTFCQNDCQLACMLIYEAGFPGCATGCETGCEFQCETHCQDNCQIVCQEGCQYDCELACQFLCQNTRCQGACEYDCQAHACEAGSCEGDCEATCQAISCTASACESGYCTIAVQGAGCEDQFPGFGALVIHPNSAVDCHHMVIWGIKMCLNNMEIYAGHAVGYVATCSTACETLYQVPT